VFENHRGGILAMLKCRTKGFTLIELLVVILILAILMAIALPLYLRAVRDSNRQTCRSNMQTVANAEQAYKVRSSGHAYTAAFADLTTGTNGGDLTSTPVCPENGVYSLALVAPAAGESYTPYVASGSAPAAVTIPQGTVKITCSLHGTFVPGVDSQ
jgi:type IV pilus assembly protein PilA